MRGQALVYNTYTRGWMEGILGLRRLRSCIGDWIVWCNMIWLNLLFSSGSRCKAIVASYRSTPGHGPESLFNAYSTQRIWVVCHTSAFYNVSQFFISYNLILSPRPLLSIQTVFLRFPILRPQPSRFVVIVFTEKREGFSQQTGVVFASRQASLANRRQKFYSRGTGLEFWLHRQFRSRVSL